MPEYNANVQHFHSSISPPPPPSVPTPQRMAAWLGQISLDGLLGWPLATPKASMPSCQSTTHGRFLGDAVIVMQQADIWPTSTDVLPFHLHVQTPDRSSIKRGNSANFSYPSTLCISLIILLPLIMGLILFSLNTLFSLAVMGRYETYRSALIPQFPGFYTWLCTSSPIKDHFFFHTENCVFLWAFVPL